MSISTFFSSGDWKAYWNPQQLFVSPPPVEWRWIWAYAALGIASLILGIALIFTKKLHPGLRERLSTLAWTEVILSAILFFCRYQRIPYFGIDGLRTLQEIGLVIWVIITARYARVQLPADRLAAAIEEKRQKYLPKAK